MNGRQLLAAAGTYGEFYAYDITGSNGADNLQHGPFTGLINVTARGGDDVIVVAAVYGLIDARNGTTR